MEAANGEENARRLFSSRKYSEAAEAYARLADEQPDRPKWLTNRALCLFHLKKHATAIKLCRKSIIVDKTWSRGYEVAAQCLLALQRNKEAEDVLVEGMAAAPTPGLEKLLNDARVAICKQANLVQYDAPPLAGILANLVSGQGPPVHPFHSSASTTTTTATTAATAASTASMPRGGGSSEKQQSEHQNAHVQREHLQSRAQRQSEVAMRAAVLENTGRLQDAMPLYEQGARSGCTISMAALARIFLHGEGVPSHPRQGISWARKCIEHGPNPLYESLGQPDLALASAQELLGTAYRHGLGGLDKDLAEAERWLRAAAQGGYPLGMNNLASLLTQLARPDNQTATPAVVGDKEAQDDDGAMSMQCREEEAVVWYRRAAELGYARAMVNLGAHLRDGTGCARDVKEATVWLDKAAAAGDLLAVGGLVMLAKEQPGAQGVAMLEAVRRHVQVARSREEAAGKGRVQGSTLCMEAGLCLEIQRARDGGMDQEGLIREVEAAMGGEAPPSFEVFVEGKPPSLVLVTDYREMLMEQLARCREPTQLEREAALLAERAARLMTSSSSSNSSSSSARSSSSTAHGDSRLDMPSNNNPSDPEPVAHTLVDVGALFIAKGREEEAHKRFLLPAAEMGNPQACHLAGRYLAGKQPARGRDLRAAQRLLSRAVAGDVPGARWDLDALTARLARGDVGGVDGGADVSGGGEEDAGLGGEPEAAVDPTEAIQDRPSVGNATGRVTGGGGGEGQRHGAPHASWGQSAAKRGVALQSHSADDGDAAKAAAAAAGLQMPEEAERLTQDMMAAMGLNKPASVDTDNPFIPGGLPVHLPLLEEYVRSHCDSYTGWALLHSRRHFENALLAVFEGRYGVAVRELCNAVLFDEKGVQMPFVVDKQTGQVVAEPVFQPLFDLMDRELRKGHLAVPSSTAPSSPSAATGSCGSAAPSSPSPLSSSSSCPSSLPASSSSSRSPPSMSLFFHAAVVKMATSRDLRDRVRYAELALQAAPPRLLPAVRRWRGLLAVFLGDLTRAMADLEATLKLLRTDASTSLWPYDPPELAGGAVGPGSVGESGSDTGEMRTAHKAGPKGSLAGGMAHFREVMAYAVECEIGRLALMLGRPDDAVTHIKRFQRGVPEDTHRLCESFADLGEAIMGRCRARGPGGLMAELGTLQGLVREADRTMKLRVPVFRPLRPEDFPKMEQMRSMVAMMAHMEKQGPNRSLHQGNGGLHSAARSSAAGKGKGSAAAGTGSTAVMEGSGASSSWGAGAGSITRSCFGCGVRAESLRKCAQCRLAEYCSPDCQRKHWKEGHKTACARMAKG
eukprot:jgi/Mesvir1/7960/Mv11872-RA.1